MTTQELNNRITLMQEDNRLIDLWVAACGMVSTLVIILIFLGPLQ